MPERARDEYDLGLQEMKRGHNDEARKHFEKAVSRYPQFAQALHQLALHDIHSGKNEAAFDRLQIATASDPAFPDSFMALAYVCNLLQRDHEAVTAAERAIALAPGVWRGHFELGKALLALGDVANADAAAGRMETMAPNQPETHLLRAGVQMKKLDYERARTELNTFLTLAPNHRYAELARKTLQEIGPN